MVVNKVFVLKVILLSICLFRNKNELCSIGKKIHELNGYLIDPRDIGID